MLHKQKTQVAHFSCWRNPYSYLPTYHALLVTTLFFVLVHPQWFLQIITRLLQPHIYPQLRQVLPSWPVSATPWPWWLCVSCWEKWKSWGINSRPISPKFLRILVDDQLFSVGIPKFWQIFHIVKRAPTGNFWVLFGVPLDQWDRGDPASDWAGEKLSSASAREVAGIPSGIAAFNYCFHLFLDILVSLPILCFRHEL